MDFKSTINFGPADRAVTAGAEDGLAAGAQHILDVSNQRVPTKSGALRASGRVVSDGLTAAVTYGDAETAGYATIQHEDLTLHHDDGQPKFLESAQTGERGQVGEIIASRVRRRT